MQFYRDEPTARSSWRLAVLMGANERTYKFALGSALLQLAAEGRESVSLDQLARPYAMALVRRAQRFPQATLARTLGPKDFLTVLAAESPASLAAGAPTGRLTAAAASSMASMVMLKFHNLRDSGSGMAEVAHRFYRPLSRGQQRVVFTDELRTIAADEVVLGAELGARWSIVETSFDASIGRSLTRQGVVVSEDGKVLHSPLRRARVSKARDALMGFQHGRCFHCHERFMDLDDRVDVDHLFPYANMRTGSWKGPDLNAVWNLVVSCGRCNNGKGARHPAEEVVQRLHERNEAIVGSPHPLRQTLMLTMSTVPGREAKVERERMAFLRHVDRFILEGPGRSARG